MQVRKIEENGKIKMEFTGSYKECAEMTLTCEGKMALWPTDDNKFRLTEEIECLHGLNCDCVEEYPAGPFDRLNEQAQDRYNMENDK